MVELAFVLLALTFIFQATSFAQAHESPYALQVGAGGDNASRGSTGIAARIRTHVYQVSADYGNSFWVGDILSNGAFIQFGYELSSAGFYCLRGETVETHTFCNGSADSIGDNDARWFWQYWPNPNVIDFYFGIGPANSAGPDNSWHLYQIMPNELDGWTFAIDGKLVSDLNSFKWTHSRDPPLVVAEEVTSIGTSPSGRLGPVEFSDLSYSQKDGWHQVDSLQAVSVCIGTGPGCDVPYGLKLLGANHIIAGAGEQPREDGELLWTGSFSLTLSIPNRVQVHVDHTLYSSGTVELALSSGLHTVTVPAIIDINDTSRLRFQSWSDGSKDPTRSMNLTADVSLAPVYVKQSKLTIISPFPNSADGWYDEGSSVIISTSASRSVNGLLGALGARLEFVGWYENGQLILTAINGSIKMDAGHTLVEGWTTNYTLPIVIIDIILAVVGIAVLTYNRKSRK